jgi:hypothetical protein
MTSLFLSVICSFTAFSPGIVEMDVWYQHEWPPGQSYTYSSSDLLPTGVHTAHAEGWPVYIRLTQGGKQIGQCTYDPAIFIDGVEDGTTGSWHAHP